MSRLIGDIELPEANLFICISTEIKEIFFSYAMK